MRIRTSGLRDPNSTWPGVLEKKPRASVRWYQLLTMIRLPALRKQYALSSPTSCVADSPVIASHAACGQSQDHGLRWDNSWLCAALDDDWREK